MSDNEACLLKSPTRTPWNKGKLIGAKPPLRPKHVWSIRTRLMIQGRTDILCPTDLSRSGPIPAIVCRTSGDDTRAIDTKGFDQQTSPR